MSSRYRPPFMWQLLALLAALLLCGGSLHSAYGQFFPGEKRGVSRIKRAPNPQTNQLSSKRPSKKQQAIEQAIKLGNQARNANDYYQALAHYQSAQKLNPQEARAYYGLGNVYSDLYCSDSAIEAYRKAIGLKKDYIAALVGLGYAYAEEGRYDHAEEQFRMALAISADDVEANIGLGLIYAKKERYEEAIKQINQVIKAQAIEDQAAANVALGDVYAERHINWKEVAAQYEKAISLKPDLAKAYFKLGIAQLFTSKTVFRSLNETKPQDLESLSEIAKQATNNIKRAKDLNYKHPEVYAYLGLSLAFQFRFQEAVSQINVYFDKVKELENGISSLAPKCDCGFNCLNAVGYTFLGYVYGLEGKLNAVKKQENKFYNEAIKQFKQAIELKQDFDLAYGLLGAIYFNQGNYEEALKQFKMELLFSAREPDKAYVYEHIGDAYAKMERYGEAIDQFKEAIRLNPNEASFYESLANIYAAQRKYEEAYAVLNKAIELKKGVDADLYLKLGIIYAAMFDKNGNKEDLDKAIRLMKKSIEIKPDDAAAYEVLGLAYKMQLNADEALANFKIAADYAPKNPEIYNNMAHVYFDLQGNADAAIKLLKQAIELKSDFPKAYLYLGEIYHYKGDTDEAIKQILKAIEFDPKFLEAYLGLAYIYNAQKNYPEAIKYMKKAIEIAPTASNPYGRMAEIYENQGSKEDAARYYEEAANRVKADDLSNKNFYLGCAARLRGRYADAINYFQKLIPLKHPQRAYYEIGLTYIVSGNKSAALEQYQQLLRLKSPLSEELLKKINEME